MQRSKSRQLRGITGNNNAIEDDKKSAPLPNKSFVDHVIGLPNIIWTATINWAPISTFIGSYKALAPLVGGNYLLIKMSIEILAVVAINAIQLYATFALSQNKRAMDKLFHTESTEGASTQMAKAIAPYISHLVVSVICSYVTDAFVRENIEASLKAAGQREYTERLLGKKPMHFIIGEPSDGKKMLTKLPKDIGLLVRIVTNFVSTLAIATFNGGLAATYLYSSKNANASLITSFILIKSLVSLLVNTVSQYLSTKYSKNVKEVNDIRVDIQKMESNNLIGAISIAGARAEEAVLVKTLAANEKLQEKELIVTNLQIKMAHWSNFALKLDQALDYMLVLQGASLSPKEIFDRLYYLSAISSFFNWRTSNGLQALEAEEAYRRIDKFNKVAEDAKIAKSELVRKFVVEDNAIRILNALVETPSSIGEKSTIFRSDQEHPIVIKLERIYSASNLLDLPLEIDQSSKKSPARFSISPSSSFRRLAVDNIQETGSIAEDRQPKSAPARFLFEGESGSGKSTLFKAIAGLFSQSISASGIITIPQYYKDDILYLAQQHYMLKPVTLLELVIFPRAVNQVTAREAKDCLSIAINFIMNVDMTEVPSIKEKFIPYAQELHAHLEEKLLTDGDFKLQDIAKNIEGAHEEVAWDENLSGGEKQIYTLIGALCKKPRLLLLDETLTGMDKDLLPKVRAYLHAQLNTTVIGEIFHFSGTGHDASRDSYSQIIDFNRSNAIVSDRRLLTPSRSFASTRNFPEIISQSPQNSSFSNRVLNSRSNTEEVSVA